MPELVFLLFAYRISSLFLKDTMTCPLRSATALSRACNFRGEMFGLQSFGDYFKHIQEMVRLFLIIITVLFVLLQFFYSSVSLKALVLHLRQ